MTVFIFENTSNHKEAIEYDPMANLQKRKG